MNMLTEIVAQFMAFIKSILELFGVDTSKMPSIKTEEDEKTETDGE